MYARIYCIHHACMPGLATQNYAAYPYYARSIASIMPGQTWRDNGHKALMPVVTAAVKNGPGLHFVLLNTTAD